MEDFQLRKEPASKYVGTINANQSINPNKRGEALSKSTLKIIEPLTRENAVTLPEKS
jgi:hypothetical protein